MSILIVNYEYPPIGAGASTASELLAKALVKQGHDVVVITSAFKTMHGYALENGIHVYRLPAIRHAPGTLHHVIVRGDRKGQDC